MSQKYFVKMNYLNHVIAGMTRNLICLLRIAGQACNDELIRRFCINIILVVFSFFATSALFGQSFQYRSKYPDIPIVDVHSHASQSCYDNLKIVSETIKQKYGSNLVFWISLSPSNPATKHTVADRMLFAVYGTDGKFDGDIPPKPYNAYEGVGVGNYAEEVIRKVKNDGYVGIKIHFGLLSVLRRTPEQVFFTKLDDPRLAPLFSRLEEENILMTSLHIAEPNGPFDKRPTDPYLRVLTHNDPVFFWGQIRSFENVLAKYPNLTIVAAHAAYLFAQDAQVDYLRYLLSTYPNLYLDISVITFHMHYLSRDNFRHFFIEYQDRLLFGMDYGTVPDNRIGNFAEAYAKFFAALETDEVINLGYFGNIPTQGLDLPREVLENIYYRNALKLYPGLRKAMEPFIPLEEVKTE